MEKKKEGAGEGEEEEEVEDDDVENEYGSACYFFSLPKQTSYLPRCKLAIFVCML